MTATTSEMLEAYAKILNCNDYKNMEGPKVGIEVLQKSLVGNDFNKQVQAWQTVLSDQESFINKSMHMWSELLKNNGYVKLTGLQQIAAQMPKIDMNSFAGLQNHLGELLNTDNMINFKLSEAIDYAYESAKEEAGKPEISKEELGNVVREEIKNDNLGKTDIGNNKFKEKFYVVIKFFLISVILPLVLNVVYDLGKVQFGKDIKLSAEDDAPVIYEIHNENTYVNIIDQTDKKYRVFFIDNDGNVIDGYTDKENIDMNFEDDENER